MKKLKYIFIGLFSIVSLIGLTACSSSSDVKVTYMVESSVYKVLEFDSISDVVHPTAPNKDGSSFVGWYTDSTFKTGTLFDKTTYSAELTFNLYARFAENTVTTYVDGEKSGNIVITEAETSKPTKEDFSFDGWYIDPEYTTEYNNQDVDNLYGRFRALVTISNGYEELYSEFVTPGDTISEPNYNSIRKNYMAENGYYHFTTGEFGTEESLNKFDFNTGIDINTTINLMWESEGLTYSLSDSNTLSVSRPSATTSAEANPSDILSVPSRAYYNDIEYDVVVANGFYYGATKKIIFNYNIKGISNTNTKAFYPTSSNLEEVVLPDSLKIIVSSFTDTTSFTENSITLNNGIEVIIDSFRLGYNSSDGYNFDIAVPDSIEYMALVTTNYTFGNNSSHYVENIEGEKAIFTDILGKKTLVSYIPANTRDIVIPEGIYGINASAFTIMALTLDTLSLPSTFDSVNNYPVAADYYYMNSSLFTSVNSYSILQNLEVTWDTKAISTIKINQTSLSDELDNCLMGQLPSIGYINYKNAYFDGSYKVLFTGESTGQVFVSVYVTNLTTGEKELVSIELQSGSVITKDYLLTQVMINGTSLFELIDSGEYVLNNILEFGEVYFVTNEVTITSNVYLTLNYSLAPVGAELTLSECGTFYIVTGFDFDTAKLQDDGTYLVNIPSEFNGIVITEVAEEAMANQVRIGKVVIPNTVTIIGAKAFYNCSNLTELEIQGAYGVAETINGVAVYGTIGKVEYIYESAFEGTSIVSPVMGLESMKYIAPYAFKSSTITHFTNVDLTTTAKGGIKTSSNAIRTDLVIGNYYYSFETVVGFIYRYQGQEYETYNYPKSGETTVLTLDLDIVAIAGGYNTYGFYHSLTLGYSGRSISFGDMGFITRVEILEGSIYYLNDFMTASKTGLVFVNVTKVHKNAFTDMGSNFNYVEDEVYRIISKFDPLSNSNRDDINYISLEEYVAVSTADYYTTYVDDNGNFNGIFAEGWWQGVMADDADYKTKMIFMSNLYSVDGIWLSF